MKANEPEPDADTKFIIYATGELRVTRALALVYLAASTRLFTMFPPR